MGVLRHDAGDDRDVQLIELVGEAIYGNSIETGVADDDGVRTLRSGVAVEQGVDVCVEVLPDAGKGLEELHGHFLGALLDDGVALIGVLFVELEREGDLLTQAVCDIFRDRRDGGADVVSLIGPVDMVTGVEDAQQLVDDLDDGIGAGDAVHVEVVDDTAVVIVGHDVVYDLDDALFDEVFHGFTAFSLMDYL